MGNDVILDKLDRYKSNGEAIRYIVSTDTFEEEDVTVDSTAEERRDAADMVKLNRLRLTDPIAYERLREEEQEGLLYQREPSRPNNTARARCSKPMQERACHRRRFRCSKLKQHRACHQLWESRMPCRTGPQTGLPMDQACLSQLCTSPW